MLRHISGDWPHFLSGALLVAIRLSGLFTFAPVFSSQAIPVWIKAGLCLVLALLLAPVIAALPGSRPEVNFGSVLSELFVSMVFGIFLSLINEVALFAGQLIGLHFSFRWST